MRRHGVSRSAPGIAGPTGMDRREFLRALGGLGAAALGAGACNPTGVGELAWNPSAPIDPTLRCEQNAAPGADPPDMACPPPRPTRGAIITLDDLSLSTWPE